MKIFVYIIVFNILFGITESTDYKNLSEKESEAPTLKLNFYLMGKSDIDQEIILSIGDNVEYLNNEFEGKIKFELNKLFLERKHQYLPDVYKSFRNRSKHRVRELVEDIEEAGAINIYLLDTYAEGPNNKALMGFTPVLTGMQRTYARNSPRFDRMFIAYPGLGDKSTIVHEMGHFLGLKHPWEMTSSEKEKLGLTDENILYQNHMTYNLSVDSFTSEQLNKMQAFAWKFREYLMKEM